MAILGHGGHRREHLALRPSKRARREDDGLAVTVRLVGDEFESSALARTGVMNSGATLQQRDVLSRPQPQQSRPKLAAADFGSEKRPRNGYVALSLSRRARRQHDA